MKKKLNKHLDQLKEIMSTADHTLIAKEVKAITEQLSSHELREVHKRIEEFCGSKSESNSQFYRNTLEFYIKEAGGKFSFK
ncbi:MAG: hypothetical protein CMF46_00860 [Legionellales bacterium]|nr:hypothetical protein [Legionellales bacterium]